MGKSNNTSFLALDIGQSSVRGIAFARFKGKGSYFTHTESGGSIKQNIINAIDVIEEKMGVKFKTASITGNFGIVETTGHFGGLAFPKPKIVNSDDVYNAIFGSDSIKNTGGQFLHLIPTEFKFDDVLTSSALNIRAGKFDVAFNTITYAPDIINEIKDALGSACIPPNGFFDPIYLLGQAYHKTTKQAVFIDFGKTKTAVGVIKNGALVQRFDMTPGQDEVTKRIEENFGIPYQDAEEIKKSVAKTAPGDADEYISASPKYKSLTQSDVWGVWFDVNNTIVSSIMDMVFLDGADIYIMGPEINAENIKSMVLQNKGLDNINILTEYAAVGAVFKIMNSKPGAGAKSGRTRALPRMKSIPIVPGIMDWNFKSPNTYRMFQSVGIKKIHIDIMDGFYTQKVSGMMEDLALIRSRTELLLHTHLMVEDSIPWTERALELGADIILLSTGTRGLTEAIGQIKRARRKAGLAIHPDFELKKLTPGILNMLDEIMIMGVMPGSSGQAFFPDTVSRIRVMANTRGKYGFKYKITVDGGINDKTAPLCWSAGADFLVSGSYLKNAPDLADALASLLQKS